MKSVEIFLIGGFGNNLFQICLGEYLKSKGVSVTYNTYLRKRNILTRLAGWSIHDDVLTEKLLSGEKVTSDISLAGLIGIVFEFVKHRLGIVDLQCFDDKKTEPNKSTKLIGYWQQGPHLRESIFGIMSQKMLSVARDLGVSVDSIKELVGENVVVHYRGGDFPLEWRLSKTYYHDCLSGIDETRLVVVTNDKEAASRIFKDAKQTEFKSLADDFFALFFAKTLIGSNSTFCYWAAMLGCSEKVYFPSHLHSQRQFNLPVVSKNCFFVPFAFIE